MSIHSLYFPSSTIMLAQIPGVICVFVYKEFYGHCGGGGGAGLVPLVLVTKSEQ